VVGAAAPVDESFGAQIRRRRVAAGLTQEELAERCGLGVRTISNMERGRTIQPHRRSVDLLYRALGLAGPVCAEPAAPFSADLGATSTSASLLADRLENAGQAGGAQHEQVVPRQLPVTVRQLTGRADELEVLDGLLDLAGGAPGTVVISAIGGTAGVGKTTLAVHWAHRVTARFPDGQLYVNLRGFDPSGTPMAPAEAIKGFLDALQVPVQQIPASLDAQAGLYRSLMAGKRMLLVLDNARDGAQVRPLLPGSPACCVIVTSRRSLTTLIASQDAHLLTLDVLTEAGARELLSRRLGPERVLGEPEAVDELIGLCARLPLALAIAAARAAAAPAHPLSALAGELRQEQGRLDALDTGDAATSARAVFSWSYQSLSDQAARMFRWLGLHPGPDISAAGAASLAGVGLDEARATLKELTWAHLLVEHAPARFACHDLLRAYAAEQARRSDGDDDRRAAIHRMLDHYLHTGHDAARLMQPQRGSLALAPAQPGVTPEPLADHDQALAWFKAEHHVLLSAITLAAETRFDTCAWQLPWSLATFLDWQGHWHDWAATQRIALAAVTRQDDRAAQAMVRRAFAAACIRLADYDEAHAHLTECLSIYAQLGDGAGESRIHRDLGNLFEYQDRYDEALDHAEQALRLSQAVSDKTGQAAALTNAGSYHAMLGHYQQALVYSHQALDLHRELGARYGEAHTWLGIGYIEHHLGSFNEAAASHQQALTLFRELGDRVYEATALAYLGDTHHAYGNRPAARDAWRQALAILLDLQHPDADKLRAKLDRTPAVGTRGWPAQP
jgi:tetratricopeptide (TPR) repeat protein/transcriptional regulator with XRE-family HTH domain